MYMVYQRKTSIEMRDCAMCGKNFPVGNQARKRFCEVECRKKFHKPFAPLSDTLARGTVGAIGELEVSIDLMEKGFEVFRALSPSSSCDILVQKAGKTYALEVRTGYYRGGEEKMEKVIYSPANIHAPYLAIFIRKINGNDDIKYEPDFTKE